MRIIAALLLVAFAAGCAAPKRPPAQAVPLRPTFPPAPAGFISVVVWGEVSHPQLYSFPKNTRLAEAIRVVGGFKSLAQKNAVRVRHRDGTLDQYDLQPGDPNYAGDTVLSDGDVLIVPRRLSE